MLYDPVFADYLAAYGAKGPEAIAKGGLKKLARMYWYMVEFGLIMTDHGWRAYGAGHVVIATETIYSVTDPTPNRVAFDLERVMATDYAIDDFQKTYFRADRLSAAFRCDGCRFCGTLWTGSPTARPSIRQTRLPVISFIMSTGTKTTRSPCHQVIRRNFATPETAFDIMI